MITLCLSVCTIWTVSCEMSPITACEANSFAVCFLLLEGSSLDRLVGSLFVLAVWVVLLHHVGARVTLTSILKNILSPSLLLNIKRCYQVFN